MNRVLEELFYANLDSDLQEKAACMLAVHKDLSFLAKEFDKNEVSLT